MKKNPYWPFQSEVDMRSSGARLIEQTPAGAQTVLPGAERVSGAAMAQRRADAPLKPKANQRACDVGLFSDERDQNSLI